MTLETAGACFFLVVVSSVLLVLFLVRIVMFADGNVYGVRGMLYINESTLTGKKRWWRKKRNNQKLGEIQKSRFGAISCFVAKYNQERRLVFTYFCHLSSSFVIQSNFCLFLDCTS